MLGVTKIKSDKYKIGTCIREKVETQNLRAGPKSYKLFAKVHLLKSNTSKKLIKRRESKKCLYGILYYLDKDY